MMFVELPLFTRTCLVLKPFIMSIMTRGSSCGCFTPRAPSLEKTMSKFSLLRCLGGRITWMLFTCLCCDFLRDLNDPPGPLLIILISPIMSLRQSCGRSSFLGFSSDLVHAVCFARFGPSFLTNFCNFPFWINSSICSFRSLQSSV